jgi:hypothetical protein
MNTQTAVVQEITQYPASPGEGEPAGGIVPVPGSASSRSGWGGEGPDGGGEVPFLKDSRRQVNAYGARG